MACRSSTPYRDSDNSDKRQHKVDGQACRLYAESCTNMAMSRFGKTAAARDRLDWLELRDRIDVARVATALLGPAPGRRGERGRRLWWKCPLHADKNPSFCVERGRGWWKCF